MSYACLMSASISSPERDQIVALGTYDAVTIGNMIITRLAESRISTGFRIDWIAECDGERFAAKTLYNLQLADVLAELATPTVFTQPDCVIARCRALNAAAGRCYELRNAADGVEAIGLEEIGDVYLTWSVAIGREWE